jgi:peptide deformylase
MIRLGGRRYAAEGMGLAAPQIGVSKRLMVMNIPGNAARRSDEVGPSRHPHSAWHNP